MSRSYTYEEYMDAVQYFNCGTNDFFLIMHLPLDCFVNHVHDKCKGGAFFEIYRTDIGYLYVDSTYKVYGISQREPKYLVRVRYDNYIACDDTGSFQIDMFTNDHRNTLYELYVK